MMPFEDGMVEFDLELHLEAVEGLKSRPLVSFTHFHGPPDSDKSLGRGLLFDSR
jgi:hypothetical protein